MIEYVVKWVDCCDVVNKESVFGMDGLAEFLNKLYNDGGNTVLTVKGYFKERE